MFVRHFLGQMQEQIWILILADVQGILTLWLPFSWPKVPNTAVPVSCFLPSPFDGRGGGKKWA